MECLQRLFSFRIPPPLFAIRSAVEDQWVTGIHLYTIAIYYGSVDTIIPLSSYDIINFDYMHCKYN